MTQLSSMKNQPGTLQTPPPLAFCFGLISYALHRLMCLKTSPAGDHSLGGVELSGALVELIEVVNKG